MNISRSSASCLALGVLIAAPLVSFQVRADDYGDSIDHMPVNRIADHCAQFGPGFVDVGGGVCGRVTSHVRVYVGTRNVTLAPAWPTQGTANAALRSDGMVPGAEVMHFRVHGSLDSFSPFH